MAGTYSITLGATTAATCVACAVGTYSTTVEATDSSTCLDCPDNSLSMSGSGDLADCSCDVGYTGADGTACTACDAGTHKTLTGSGTCTSCLANTHSAAGMAACSPCPDFTSSASGSSDCTCNAGYTAGSDVDECNPCIAGTYKADPGPVSCTACLSGMDSDEGSIECQAYFCVGGYKWTDDDVCIRCEANTYCTNGVVTNCPSNTRSAAGSISEDNCTCTSGHFSTF